MEQTEIKPQDLRIGNLVHIKDSDYCNVFEVHGINQSHVKGRFKRSVSTRETSLGYDEIDGISLTEELLRSLGFESFTYLDDKFNKVKGCLELSIFGHRIYANDLKKSKVKYLHQLQNYAHAITGSELKVNIKF